MIDKIQWQSGEHVYWVELTESTFPNRLAGIDKTMEPCVGFLMRVGTTSQGTGQLQDGPEDPQPLAEMIRITNSRLVRIWWSLNPPSEPMDLLICCHRRNDTEDSTSPPGEIQIASRDNRGPLQMPQMTGLPVAIMDRAHMATSHSHPLRPQSDPPQQGPHGPVIPQRRLGEHTASIGRTLANQSQRLPVRKLLSLLLT